MELKINDERLNLSLNVNVDTLHKFKILNMFNDFYTELFRLINTEIELAKNSADEEMLFPSIDGDSNRPRPEIDNTEPKESLPEHFINFDPIAFNKSTPGITQEENGPFLDKHVVSWYDRILDKRGIPWDERVHSAGKSIKKNGAWRPKKGLDKKYIKNIEKELKDSTNTVKNPQIQVAEIPTDSETFKKGLIQHNHLNDVALNGGNVTVAIAPPPPPPPVPPVLQAIENPLNITVEMLIKKILSITKSGKMSPKDVVKLQQGMGINNLSEIIDQPELAQYLYAALEEVEA